MSIDSVHGVVNLRRRAPRKLATTTITNEIMDAMAGLIQPPLIGQVEEPVRVVAQLGTVLVHLDSPIEGAGGKYNGRLLLGSSDATHEGDLLMPEGMTLAPNQVGEKGFALVLNLSENGRPDHSLHTGSTLGGLWPNNRKTIHIGKIVGRTDAAEEPVFQASRAIVVIDSIGLWCGNEVE